MGSLALSAVFWEQPDADNWQNAIVTVEDGDAICITREDGFTVVILVNDFGDLARFVAAELEEYDRLHPEEVTYVPDKDGVPF